MLTRTYKQVADEVGLKGDQRIRYLAYMVTRWEREEETQCVTGYAKEWALRFENNIEYSSSDTLGQTILDGLNATFNYRDAKEAK